MFNTTPMTVSVLISKRYKLVQFTFILTFYEQWNEYGESLRECREASMV